MKHVKYLVEKCSDDHVIKEAYLKYNHFFWINTFLIHLNTALENILNVSTRAYNDIINNKLVAANGSSFDKHALISSLCEICVINTFIQKSGSPESFAYEPRLRADNRKNVEFTVVIEETQYNVEVKSPNLSNYYAQLCEKIEEHGVVTRFDTRSFGKPVKDNQMPSPSIRVKDFLVDSDLKFPESNLSKHVNILIIAWDDHTDQPCIELKHPIHGLLTSNSWYKNSDNCPVLFPNIDLIFVSDLYKNIIAHLSSGGVALDSSITGVPYFERNLRFIPNQINPFLLPFSRNVLIKPYINLDDAHIKNIIYNVPIAFSDQEIPIVDEKYVGRHGTEIKISY